MQPFGGTEIQLSYLYKYVSKDLLDKMVEESLVKVGMWNELKDRLDSPAISLSLEKQQKLCIASQSDSFYYA